MKAPLKALVVERLPKSLTFCEEEAYGRLTTWLKSNRAQNEMLKV